MSLASLFTPVFFACLLSGLTVVAAACGFLWLRKEVQKLPPPSGPDPAIQLALAERAAEIEELKLRLEELEQRKGPLLEWAASEPSVVNLNRRGQVLRLHRRGDSIAHIASALGLSTGEVALIIKVQGMLPSSRNPQMLISEL